MSWGNQGNLVHSNPSINQQTEKKPSKRKAPYRPLERTEQLKRKAWWKTEAQSVKRSTLKKKEPSQVSMRTKKKLWLRTRSWVEEVPRECHMKNQLEEIGALQSAKKKKKKKKNWTEKAKATARKSISPGRKVPLKRNTTTMKKNLAKKFSKAKEKAIKGITEEAYEKDPKESIQNERSPTKC